MLACLPEQQRQVLAEQSRRLQDEQTRISAGLQETTTRLEAEQAKQLSELTIQELAKQLVERQQEHTDLQKAIGGLQDKLQSNTDLKMQQAERLKHIQAQQSECRRWDRLHELIGSADGKKFRNFAQGLTFELMIGQANQKLRQMSDRYLLVRNQDQPLDLDIIDDYQGGEIRSTKNLSGGESFIVSLALALGLSQMSSRNVRLDSLFLDEGFGTLDDEALDTALNTLAGLQQEGKLIGVISHVATLKERISSQIQLTPLSGGRSQLSGPGCSAL